MTFELSVVNLTYKTLSGLYLGNHKVQEVDASFLQKCGFVVSVKTTRPFQKSEDLQFLGKGHVLFRKVRICSFCEKDVSFLEK